MVEHVISSPADPSRTIGERYLPAAILIGGTVNGLMARIVEDLTSGAPSLTLGLSPFQLIALFVAGRLSLVGTGTAKSDSWWIAGAMLALILLPSSAVSWLAVAIYGSWRAATSDGELRKGALLFAAMGVCALWSSVGLKWLAAPVTTAEATLVGFIAGLIRPDIIQTGNVIGNPDLHSLVLMTACTTADALPSAAVALAAVALLLGGINRQLIGPALVQLAAFYLVVNTARLVGMAWSGDIYALLHGPLGRNAFDVVQTLAVLGLGNRASRS